MNPASDVQAGEGGSRRSNARNRFPPNRAKFVEVELKLTDLRNHFPRKHIVEE
jgi:hypothetical protein